MEDIWRAPVKVGSLSHYLRPVLYILLVLLVEFLNCQKVVCSEAKPYPMKNCAGSGIPDSQSRIFMDYIDPCRTVEGKKNIYIYIYNGRA